MSERVDIAVVGGGPAGAAAAARLAAGGRSVVVLERSRGVHHKVCGEFVSAEALAAMESLGLSPRDLGAVPLGRLRLSAGGRAVGAALPFAAAGLSRARLDAALIGAAARAGAEVRRGASVRGVRATDDGVEVALGQGRTLRAREAILATGKHDVEPGARRTAWRGRDGMLGLKMHFGLDRGAAARLGAAIELHLFEGGCAGLQPVEDGAANLCITLTRAAYGAAGADFAALLERIAGENGAFAAALDGARALWEKPLAIARVPYGFVHRRGAAGPCWRVGDQAAVTASFTGDGLALALESGIATAEALLAGEPRGVAEARFAGRAARQVRPAMALQALVDRPRLHRPAVALARLVPALLPFFARRTRLPAAGSAA